MAKFITITPHNFKKSIQRAVSILHQGDIVAFPTDTVYGVGVDAFNPKAIEKIYEVKERPADKPLPVLVASIDDVLKISTDLPSNFEELVAAFWPG
nr:Sua5/YciO/YrdC/YwlC family protein [Deltaproteobacteria bacterium]